MRRTTGTALGALLIVASAGACAGAEDPGLMPAGDAEGVVVEAQQDVDVSQSPLGDVMNGVLPAGESATATCFVRKATTNTGGEGSAVNVRAGDLEGYAAVHDFPDDPADRRMMFELDERTLREQLPPCEE